MADGRFEGALTGPSGRHGRTPAGATSLVPVRPRRPPLVEFAAAVLIIGGLTGVLGRIGAGGLVTSGPLELALLTLNLVTIVVGLLVRAGRGWVLALNVVAIVLFIEVTALPSGVAIVFAALDALVLAALIRHRDWFDRSRWPTAPVEGAAR